MYMLQVFSQPTYTQTRSPHLHIDCEWWLVEVHDLACARACDASPGSIDASRRIERQRVQPHTSAVDETPLDVDIRRQERRRTLCEMKLALGGVRRAHVVDAARMPLRRRRKC